MEHKTTYNPQPAETANIVVPDSLISLSEALAKNTHEVWAAGRIAEGWVWGAIRDDVQKRHPCLVPYEDLPEEEKEYDRRTSMETIKLILSLGYEIQGGPECMKSHE